MNQTTSRPTTSPALGQMASAMKTAVTDLKTTASNIEPNAVLAAAVSALKPLSKYGAKAWSFTSVYTRRHPVRMAISVIALGFIASRLLRAKPALTAAAKESLYE